MVAVRAVFAISMVALIAEEHRVAVVTADNSNKRATSMVVALVPTFTATVQMECAQFTGVRNIQSTKIGVKRSSDRFFIANLTSANASNAHTEQHSSDTPLSETPDPLP